MVKKNIAIIDDHKLFSDGLQSILESTNLYNIFSYNTSGDELLAEVAAVSPHVVITDFNMPVNNGIEVIKKLRVAKTTTKFIVVSVREDIYAIRQALRAGAKAYLYKNIDKEDFLSAVEGVLGGEKIFPPVYVERTNKEPKAIRISEREKDVLKLLCEGLSIKEIAENLFLSEYTIISHKKNLFEKTATTSIVMLTNYALQNGLV